MYIATFYSHFGAISAAKALRQGGMNAELRPIPRKISSSCGTCVQFEAEEPKDAVVSMLGKDLEALYCIEQGVPVLVFQKD